MNQETLIIPEEITKEIETFGREVLRFKNKEIPEEKFKRFRLQHGIYGQRQAGYLMVRVKIPAGLLNPAKLRCLADISEKYSTGVGHVTTRQDIQFHYVDLDNVTTVMQVMAEAGLTTREACGNTVRNVIACQRAGICPTELFDVSEISEAVAYHLLRNPINQDLPRKFKISFSGCQTECGLAAIHDLGFIATSRQVDGLTEYGFKLLVGGGLGSHPKLAKAYADFVSIDQVLPLCEAMLKLFDAHGNRRNKSKARMKFILEKWGIEAFKEKVEEILAEMKSEGRRYPALPPLKLKAVQDISVPPLILEPAAENTPFGKWQRTNLLPQTDGAYAVQIRLPLGDITVTQMRDLADIVECYSPAGLRTTHQQNMILEHVEHEKLSALYEKLQPIGLADDGVEKVVDVISCPGAETCQLALTGSMGLGEAISETFTRDLETYSDLGGLRIRISGCPNSCGHHHIAGIGLHGVAKKVQGKLVPHYQLHLGGGVSACDSTIGRSKIKIPAKNIPKAVMELIRIYRENRERAEPFNHFIERFTRETISEQLEKFMDLPSQDEAPDAYKDWRDDRDFSLDEIGPGECSGTVIDMIEHNLRMAEETIKKAVQKVEKNEHAHVPDLIKQAILLDCRALLYTHGIESSHDDQILKEFQHKLVEQGILSERFETFTADLGQWADFGSDPAVLQGCLDQAVALVEECQAAYDRMDASMKLKKKDV